MNSAVSTALLAWGLAVLQCAPLVDLVYLVYLVCLVERNEPEKPDEPDRPSFSKTRELSTF
jgi:hypothetical protein